MRTRVILYVLLFAFPLGFVNVLYASSWVAQKVIVTEDIPWVDCECWYLESGQDEKSWVWLEPKNQLCKKTPVKNRKYNCSVEKWFKPFQLIMAQIIRWFIFIALLTGVLFIVWLGIAWTWAGWEDFKTKASLKKWAINIAIGLAILFFFRQLLMLIAPWIYK